jgi:hypothetical protein
MPRKSSGSTSAKLAARREQLLQKIPVGPMRDLVAVGPAYPLVGPNQATLRQPIGAPASTVFRFLEDAGVWNEFLDIDVGWTTPEPRGVGTTRTVTVNNQTIEEYFMVWEPGRRMVFRFDRCTLPVRAFAESWAVTDTGDGTCELAWSTAFDWAGRGGSSAANAFRAAFSAGGRRSLAKLAALVEADPDRFDIDGGGS